MRFLARMLYAAAAKLAGVASAIVPPSGAKAAIAMRARHGVRRRYEQWAAAHRDPARPLLWMHASSVGEGLMARPVLAMLRTRWPDMQQAYTFFSPSAEEFSRTLGVDFRDYLPFDDASHMSAALEALAPRALVFSKVDVWPELVRQAKLRRIPVGMISAALAPGSRRRGSVAKMLLTEAYASLDAVGAVDRATADRLIEMGVRRDVIEITGDTRFDQVWERVQATDRASGLVARLASERPTVVAGSTWPADEAPLLEAVRRVKRDVPALRLVIAPHEVTPRHLEPIVKWARGHGFTLARVDELAAVEADVILVDRYGILAELYALADVAFVGGGFHDAGLHSVLEPAAFGAPVLFGPRHQNSRDAHLLLEADGGRAAAGMADIERVMRGWVEDAAARGDTGARARDVVDQGRGAADRSVRLVEKLLA